MRGLGPRAATLRQASAAQIGLGETNGRFEGMLVLSAKDPTVLPSMEAVVQGIIALAVLGEEKHPALAELAQSLDLSTQGNALRIGLNCPAADVVWFLREAKVRKAEKNLRP
jgi:hypothetical protein